MSQEMVAGLKYGYEARGGQVGKSFNKAFYLPNHILATRNRDAQVHDTNDGANVPWPLRKASQAPLEPG
ncbi:hypothetical protein D8B26_007444 [Coccidioides posadasii str. Silveira]|uniref:Predicted protein n=1 Tax=Coccidioides posadasii (strain RMSCC 757 / Silveira) TaxID=443226 RepID=E9CV95_COCPS|nr:predicted protein [Coccidioides posadasii str. Silveira]QVM12827.1 hypothetical protein D8B26_007444 [Coccidioides posadasii str. Silveira]